MNPTDNIKCPSCGTLIPISETLIYQITEQTKSKLVEEMAADKKALIEREKELSEKEKILLASKEEMDKELEKKLVERSSAIRVEAVLKAKSEVALEMKDLKAQADEQDKKLREAQAAELEFRKEKRELEERRRNLDLELERRLEKEIKAVRETTTQEMTEQHRLREAEKDKTIQDMLKQIEELKRKGEQGSQQAQGEVMELELEGYLKTNFPLDAIEPVPKGFSGADVLQRVQNRFGQFCGTIIWESKRTKAWSDGWIQKLKDDQREAKADIAIIVTDVLPKDVPNFGLKDGVWITNYRSLPGLATAIRTNIENLAAVRQAAVGKNEKMEVLYAYLSGPEFRQKVEAIVEAFVGMQQDLEKEKRQSEKSWAKREKQIQRVIRNTAGMYGDMQGLIGASMQPIPALEAGEVAEDIEDESEVEA